MQQRVGVSLLSVTTKLNFFSTPSNHKMKFLAAAASLRETVTPQLIFNSHSETHAAGLQTRATRFQLHLHKFACAAKMPRLLGNGVLIVFLSLSHFHFTRVSERCFCLPAASQWASGATTCTLWTPAPVKREQHLSLFFAAVTFRQQEKPLAACVTTWPSLSLSLLLLFHLFGRVARI
jgi:hypothetical protein